MVPEYRQQEATHIKDILLVEDLDEYPGSIQRQNRSYDLIVIDGKRRRSCAESAIPCLKESGMILLDNSDWYPKSAALMRDAGFIQIDFHGYGPINNYTWTTSLFLRRDVKIKPLHDRMPVSGIGSVGGSQGEE